MAMPPIPRDRGYTDDHTCLKLAPGEVVSDFPLRVGITSVAAAAEKTPVDFTLPAVGSYVASGARCGLAVATEATWDLDAPITDRVTLSNPAIVRDPELATFDPYLNGWLFAVLPSQNPSLLTAAQYADIYTRPTEQTAPAKRSGAHA